jgi:hypothetical protein
MMEQLLAVESEKKTDDEAGKLRNKERTEVRLREGLAETDDWS